MAPLSHNIGTPLHMFNYLFFNVNNNIVNKKVIFHFIPQSCFDNFIIENDLSVVAIESIRVKIRRIK